MPELDELNLRLQKYRSDERSQLGDEELILKLLDEYDAFSAFIVALDHDPVTVILNHALKNLSTENIQELTTRLAPRCGVTAFIERSEDNIEAIQSVLAYATKNWTRSQLREFMLSLEKYCGMYAVYKKPTKITVDQYVSYGFAKMLIALQPDHKEAGGYIQRFEKILYSDGKEAL